MFATSLLAWARRLVTLDDARHPRLRAALVTLAALGLGLVAGLSLLHERGVVVLAWTRIPLTAIQASGGHAFWAPIGHDDWSEATGPPRATLLEDGAPLPLGAALHDDIRQRGGGRYSFWGEGVYLSASDDTDPRENGRTYEARAPVQPPVALTASLRGLAVLLGGIALGIWASPAGRALVSPRARTLLACGFVLLVALAARGAWQAIIASDPVVHTSAFRVMGVPYTDARGWDTSGESVLMGEGLLDVWRGMRPFYPVFLAVLYFWCGPSSAVAVGANLVLGALVAPLVFLVGRRLGAGLAGFVAALAVALHPQLIDVAATVQSETLGQCLGALSVWLVLVGLRDRPGASFLGGLAIALGNLARPATLLSVGVLAPTVLLACGRGADRRWRRASLGVVALGAGLALGLGPWMIRQQITFGTASISTNSAEVLYAATSPAHGRWTPSVSHEAAAAGYGAEASIAERAEYFRARTRANLADHAGWYARHVATETARAVADLGRAVRAGAGPGLVGALLVAAWLGVVTGAASTGARLVATGAALAVGGGLVFGGDAAPVVLGAVGLVAGLAVRPAPTIVVAATAGATALTIGLTGGLVMERVNVVVLWIGALFAFRGAAAVVRLADRPRAGDADPIGNVADVESAPRRRWAGAAMATAALAILVGWPSIVIAYRTFVRGPQAAVPVPVTEVERRAITAALVERLAADGAPWLRTDDVEHLAFRRADVTRFRYPLPAYASFPQHWSSHLDPRPYARTWFQFSLLHEPCDVMHGGAVPADLVGEEAIVVGVVRYDDAEPPDPPLLEAIAILPVAAPNGPPDFSRAMIGAEAHRRQIADLLDARRGEARP